MESKTTTTSLYGDGDSERGAGGKLRKPSTRKSQPTPYARPPTNQLRPSRAATGGWFSKIVDPAYRLVAGGATKLLPFFSKITAALPPPSENPDILDGVVATIAEANEKYTNDVPQSNERPGPNEVAANGLKRNCQSDTFGQNKPKSCDNDSQISKIEQLIKGKTFSRDEINRLMEIISSKAGDVSDVERQEKNEILAIAGGTQGGLLAPFPKMADERDQGDMKTAIVRTATVSPQPSVQDEIGASPIDIARAFMGSRLSERGGVPYSVGARQIGDEFASKHFISSSSPRLSTCWPGAMAQEKHLYTTPNHRGRHGLHDFPRTPYSRTIYSKSRAKLTQSQADSRYLNTSPISTKQSQMPIFGQVKSRHDVLDSGYGSVGPVRRMRNKLASEARPRGSILFKPSKDAPSPIQQPIAFQGLLPDLQKNLEPGEASTSRQQQGNHAGKGVGNNTHVNPSCSQAVKRILEQLDSRKPTPQEKAAEIRLATAWKRSPPGASHAMLKENISFLNPEEFGSLKQTDLPDPKLISEGNKLGGNSKNQVESQERSKEAKDAIVASSQPPGINDGDATVQSDTNSGSLFSLKSTSSQLKSFQERSSLQNPSQHQSNGKHVRTSQSESGLEPSKKPPPHSSGTRPTLTQISVGRHDLSRAVSSDNGSAFAFPVSASSSILSEPPTPSVMPFSSSEVVSQPNELPAVPAYSFGTKRSTPALVFSFPFPSTSSASAQVDADDLKFSFGSDKKTRLSFGSLGKDAICY
ncbi:uncharacterized protein [Coffea arabica]|uniref:Uncharacterized protein isoform X1 n=1 Tax=Coffea arabica TaxID=13443 RepID=A0A6P6SVB2_COFAR|nr:nuclear pore complex protein NUP1-like isoform X1 [Coffea arabica]